MRTFVCCVGLFVAVVGAIQSHGQDPNWKAPGTDEAETVKKFDAEMNVVYTQLMRKFDAQGQESLRLAQKSWTMWRNDEAVLIARVGGAIGGSALRVDVLIAQADLTRRRTEVLKKYLKDVQ
jgi:uncharacterized protein YecT (DUF1311 family)